MFGTGEGAFCDMHAEVDHMLPFRQRRQENPISVGDGWEAEVEQALVLGFSDLSVGFNRLRQPGRPHEEHLERIVEAKASLDRLVGA